MKLLDRRRSLRRRSDRARANKAYRTPFAAVAICSGEESCDAAKEITGVRYLSADAPLIPLKECDRPRLCACRYDHFSDRRIAPRREADGAMPPNHRSFGVDRRVMRDRRVGPVR